MTFNYLAQFEAALAALKDERRYRVFAELERQVGRFPYAVWRSPAGPREVAVWCSNDYLGMGQHPKIVEAMCAAARSLGAGAGGTRNISGTNRAIVALEDELSDLHGKEAALVFTSGYVSNHTGIATIGRLLPNCLILSDALNHNSMIEGVRAAGCERAIWRHNDTRRPEDLLARAGRERPKPSGGRGDQGGAHGRRAAGPAHGHAHRAGHRRRRGALQGGQRSPAAAARNLHPADQLPDRATRRRAPADHPGAAPRRGPRGPPWRTR